MGNRVWPELRGSVLPHLAEGDEEAVARLASNNGQSLFWLALIREANVSGEWARALRAAWADPEGETPFPDLALAWPVAQAKLARAQGRVGRRAPELAALFAAWAAELQALAARGPAQVVTLGLAEHGSFSTAPTRSSRRCGGR